MVLIKDSKDYKKRTTGQNGIKFERNIIEDEGNLSYKKEKRFQILKRAGA